MSSNCQARQAFGPTYAVPEALKFVSSLQSYDLETWCSSVRPMMLSYRTLRRSTRGLHLPLEASHSLLSFSYPLQSTCSWPLVVLQSWPIITLLLRSIQLRPDHLRHSIILPSTARSRAPICRLSSTRSWRPRSLTNHYPD